MNIILLLSDTFRYDNLQRRAAMPVRTPNLDAFAARAVSLTRMYTGSFPTIPQRTDMTCGRIGWPWYSWQRLDLSTRNHLPKILGQAGYVSQLLCDCPHLFNAAFQYGFSGAYTLRGQEGDVPLTRMNYPIEEVMPREKTRAPSAHFGGQTLVNLHRWTNRYWGGEEDCFPPRTARMAVEWLEENYLHHPFFLWVDWFDPHEPWDPPEYMVQRYDPEYSGTPMLHPNYGKASDYTPAELRNLRAHYCAEAELVDRWVGRVLQKLDDLQLWRNSIVIFTTDHGMSLGEHNRTGKSNINPSDERCWPIYPEIAHIPFMIAMPGLQGGRAVDALLQPADILPTLLELAGLEAKPPEPLHGRSFAPLLRGTATDWDREFTVAGSFLRRDLKTNLSRKWVTPVVYTRKWAYVPIGAAGRVELYDLDADPYAEHDLAAKHPGTVRDLHAEFLAWLRELQAPPEALAVFETAK